MQKRKTKDEFVFSFFVLKFQNENGKDGMYTDPNSEQIHIQQTLTKRIALKHVSKSL